MISCIICSRQSDISAVLKRNIKLTIGSEYELVIIDNSSKNYTIFSAYKEGIRRAKGSILCFMHDDIEFHTFDWGVRVENTFKEQSIGLVGVIGSQFLPNRMASWWLCQTTKGSILQGNTIEKGKYLVSKSGVDVNEISDVVVVDGLWFCMKKEMVNICNFDEAYYDSFHCYDIDICLQVLANNKRVVVLPNVLIEHKSMGNISGDYYAQLKKFYEKWESHLPIWRGICIDETSAAYMSSILEKLQEAVCRYVYIENTKAYKLGKMLIKPLKKIKCML